MRTVLLLVLFACGGDPVLRNAPRPNTAAVAGGAAAIAGAATLADPNGQAQRVKEANKQDQEPREQKHGPSVPADVLDRLDDKKPAAGSADQKPADTEVAKPSPQPAQPKGPKSKGKPDLWQPPDCDHEPLSKRCAK